jgi:hypothetical protein
MHIHTADQDAASNVGEIITLCYKPKYHQFRHPSHPFHAGFVKNHVRMNQTLLSTVLLFINDSNNVSQLCRALLDSGAQEMLITESCIQKLGLRQRSCKITNNWPKH